MTDVALRFGARDDGLSAQFRQTNRSLDELRGNVARASGAISASFRAIGPVLAAVGFGKLTGEAIEFADELTKASARTGIAVESLQSLRLVAENADVGFDTLTNAINRMQVQLVAADGGSKEAAAALGRLGIEVAQFALQNPDEQFAQVAQAVSAIDDPAQRSAAAIALFGRAGAELLPVLIESGKEIGNSAAALELIGGPVTADAIKAVDDLGDSFGTLKVATASLATDLVSEFSPALTEGLKLLTQFVGGLRLLDGEGSNEQVNLDNRIRQLEEQRDRILASVGGDRALLGPGFRQDLAEIEPQIASLTRQLEQLEGAATRAKRAALESEFGEGFVSVTATRLPGESAQDRRVRSLNSTESPLVQIATDEKDFLIAIETEKNNELVRLAQERFFRENQIASDAAEFRAQIRETYGLQEIKFEEAKNMSIIAIAGGLFGALARENSRLAKLQQGIALAEAIWNTAAGITKALKLPFPQSLVAAAKVALVGGIQIAKIKATNYNAGSVSSGSAPSVGGGGGSASESVSVAQPEPVGATHGRVINVHLNGPIAGPEASRWLVDSLSDLINGNDTIFISSNSAQAAEIRGG